MVGSQMYTQQIHSLLSRWDWGMISNMEAILKTGVKGWEPGLGEQLQRWTIMVL